MKSWKIRSLGGSGSGNYGHKGRPGKRGGSTPAKRGAVGVIADTVSSERAESEMSMLTKEVDMFDLGDTVKSAWLAPSGTLYDVKGEHEDLENAISESLDTDVDLSQLGFSRIATSPGFKFYVDMDREHSGTKALRVIKDLARMTAPDTMSFAIYSNNNRIVEGMDDNQALLNNIETIFGFSEQ